jgi:hypothetical protein
MTTSVLAEIPEQLARKAQRMVDRGWAVNIEAVVAESLRRYLESHDAPLTDEFLRNDLEWALSGND